MEERKRKYFQLKILVLLFLVLFAWGYSIYYGREIATYKGRVSVRYDVPTIDYGSIRKVVESLHEDSKTSPLPSISLWNRKRDVSIVNTDNSNEMKVDLIRMHGDMSTVEKEHVLYGNLVLPDNLSGCVIDKDTAYKMYKSYDILGMTIILNDKKYYICGILDTTENRMLIQEKKLAEKYAYLEFTYRLDEKASRSRMTNDFGVLTKNFLSQWGFAESRVIIDKDFEADMMKTAYYLPGWFILLLIIIKMCETYRKTSKVPFMHRFTLLGIIAITIVLAWMVGIHFQVPERFIPTRWSDFDFWSQKMKEIQGNITEFNSIMPVSDDSFFKEYCYQCIMASALSILFCIMLQDKWKQYCSMDQRNGRHIWVISFCILGVTFLSIYVLYRLNMAIIPTRGYLTIFLGYIFSWLITRRVDTYMSKFR